MKIIITASICLFFVAIYPCKAQQQLKRISFLLSKVEDDKTGTFKTKTFYEFRHTIFKDYPGLFPATIDTLFFLQTYDLASGYYHLSVWNSSAFVNFSGHGNKPVKEGKCFFSENAVAWTSRWDTVAIRKEELHYPGGARNIYGARYIKSGEHYKIDTIRFKEFTLDKPFKDAKKT